MQKTEYITCIYHTILFFCSTHYVIMKIHDKRELKNITINHSADIDWQNFMKIYRICASEPYSCLAIDTTLPADDPLRFRTNLLDLLWKLH